MQTTINLTTRRTQGRLGGKVDIIGIHTMEAPEGLQTAENIANYFKRVDASAHWCVDSDSRVRVVNDSDTAWTLPGANHRSCNIEIAGYAKQTAEDWADAYSILALENAAHCAAEWVIKYSIPIRKLTDAQILSGAKGFAGHIDVNRVYRKSSHWDPGPAFPWEYFLGRVSAHVADSGASVNVEMPVSTPAPSPTWNNAGFSVEYIKARQHELNALGYTLAEDGRCGPLTTSAVKDFQSKHGLTVDGLPGPATKAKLAEIVSAPSQRANVTQLQAAVRASLDNSWGPDTDKRLDAVRAANNANGPFFPYGIRYAQLVIGVDADGSWGPKSRAAEVQATKAVQAALLSLGFDPKGIDGSWGPATQAAYTAARAALRV